MPKQSHTDQNSAERDYNDVLHCFKSRVGIGIDSTPKPFGDNETQSFIETSSYDNIDSLETMP